MKKLLLILIIGLLPLLTFSQNIEHSWERTNPGGGGAFSTIGAGPSGIVIAGSDLSGAYRSIDYGKTWDVIGINVCNTCLRCGF